MPQEESRHSRHADHLKAHQFRPRQSGNPNGLPRGKSITAILRDVLNELHPEGGTIMDRGEFGRRFKAPREQAGLTQAAAAERLGVAQQRISEYESGIRMPPVGPLLEVIRVLGLDPAIILPEAQAKSEKR